MMRILSAVVVGLLLLPGAALAAAPRCETQWQTSPPLIRGSKLTCEDGDPTCDVGSDPYSCTFRIATCFNADPPTQAACTPTDVSSTRLVSRRPRRGAATDALNHDAVYESFASLGATVSGRCANAGPSEGAACTVNADCESPGQPHGKCERTAAFDPSLHGTNRCTDGATVVVPLRTSGTRYVKDSRRFKLKLGDGRNTRTLRLVCEPAKQKRPGIYDLIESHDADPGHYVPTVDQLSVVDFTVQANHGGPLTVGHPVEMRATIDVQAEPFQAMVWYGLQDGDGHFCVVDHVVLDHLGAMYDAASRANLAIASQDDGIEQPSLTDCERTQRCVVPGEECLGFRRQVATEEGAYDPSYSDPTVVMPEEPLPGLPPSGRSFQTVTSYLCSTQAWAAAELVRHQSAPTVLTPADLAGSVQQRHVLGASGQLPASCAPLVGATGVSAWISFDPEGATSFVQRPVYEVPEYDPDAELDQEHDEANRARDAYLQRLDATTAVGGVEADDGGLDVDFRHLNVGSSVTLISEEDHPGGDLHVDAEYSLNGTPTLGQQEALPGASMRFRFTLQPVGEPRADCEHPSPSLDAVPVLIAHANEDGTVTGVPEETVTALSLGAEHDKSFPLYLPAAVRAQVYGDWSCWDRFDIHGCLETDLPASPEMSTDNDCATTGVVVLRDRPPEGAETVEPPQETLQAAALLASVSASACDESLLQQYADNMARYFELENSVQITEFYTYDFMRWVWGTITPGTKGDGLSYITTPERQKGYFGHIKAYLEECEALGGVNCHTTWGFRNSPWNIDIADYRNKLLPYFWNGYGRSGAENYLKFKNNPQEFTRGGFTFECSGIASGTVCSEINYDLARVPQLASRIRDVLVNRRQSDPLAAKISPHGVHRCLDRGYPSLQRTNVDANGKPTIVPDDDVFYTAYLNRVCEKGKFKAEADRIWQQILSTCTYVSKPFADSGVGIHAGRFVPKLYGTYDTGYKLGLKGVIEGGIVNDYIVNTNVGQFKLIFGAQGRIYLESDPTNSVVGGWLNVHDIFKTWMLGNIYSDVLSSNVEAGFHILTHDIWKISFKLPNGEYELPEPPELSKEKEKCKYLWKPPMPFRIELCGGVGGKLELGVAAKISKNDLDGVDPNKSDWPGMSGTITPSAAITNSGRAGVDVLVASAGIVVVIDPTIGVEIPVEVGAKWNIGMPAPRLLNFTLAPYVKVALELKALGGELNGYTRWKIGGSGESTYPIVEWDPLDIGNLLGQEWTIVKHSWDVSGNLAF